MKETFHTEMPKMLQAPGNNVDLPSFASLSPDTGAAKLPLWEGLLLPDVQFRPLLRKLKPRVWAADLQGLCQS